MRFKLLSRRLTISAPRMAVRSAMPWPLRWAGVAIMLGFAPRSACGPSNSARASPAWTAAPRKNCCACAPTSNKLREERDKAQSVFNTSASLLTAEKAAQERMVAQLKSLEAENRALRDDLGFFEKLIPTSGAEGVAIRAPAGGSARRHPAANGISW